MNGSVADKRTRASGSGERPGGSKRRQANVYDAVADRVARGGFRGVSNPFDPVNTNNPAATEKTAVFPEEVLFRRLKAPIRYMEDDFYFANERLPEGPHGKELLPDSDLLKALHAYCSDFYASATTEHGKLDWMSMDETALLAIGILLEEAAAESLGETGDMVFVEGENVDKGGP